MPDGGGTTLSTPLLLPSPPPAAPSGELIGVDEMLCRFAGEFGPWQRRHFVLTSLAWALNAFHTLVVVFADRDLPAGSDRAGSTVAEWGLVGPERYKIGFAQSAFFAGSMVGAGLFGHLSDAALGRKGALTVSSAMSAFSGLLTAFAPSFPFYAALRFLTGLSTGGVGLSAFVLTTEPIGPSKRAAAAMSSFCFFSLGTAALAVAALLLPSSWRLLYLASSLPSLLFLLFVLPFVSESPRWHLVRRNLPAAMQTMQSIAKANGHHLPPNISLTLDCKSQNYNNATILDVVKSPTTRTRLALSVLINLISSIAYYGLTLNVSNLNTDIHLSVILNAVAEVPAHVLTAILLKRCGRRLLVVGTMWFGAAFCAAGAVAGGVGGLRTGCGVVGIFAATATFDLLYMYTAELFPTTVRNAALGCVTQAGQTGAVVAPMVVVMGGRWAMGVFGVCGVVGGGMGFGLPETLGRPMYDTMEGLESGEGGKEEGVGFV